MGYTPFCKKSKSRPPPVLSHWMTHYDIFSAGPCGSRRRAKGSLRQYSGGAIRQFSANLCYSSIMQPFHALLVTGLFHDPKSIFYDSSKTIYPLADDMEFVAVSILDLIHLISFAPLRGLLPVSHRLDPIGYMLD
jgi:hypothetical protein